MATANMVVFKDAKDKNSENHFGIKLGNNSLLCLCCGGLLKSKEYKIVEEYYTKWPEIEQALKQQYGVA